MQIRISKLKVINVCLCVLLLSPFLLPRGISEVLSYSGGILSKINTLFYWARWGVIGVLGCLIIIKRIRLSGITIAASCYYLYSYLICAIRNTDTSTALSDLAFVAGFLMIADFYIAADLKSFIQALFFVLGIIVISNALLVFLFPQGMYTIPRGDTENWLLGYYNAHIFTCLPWLVLYLMRSVSKFGKLTWRAILVIIFVLIGIYVAGSKTSSVALAVFLLACIGTLKIGKIQIPNVVTIMVGSAAVSYAIIILGVQKYFADFIENVLHKDTSFSNRTILWDTALSAFQKHPFLGNGAMEYTLFDTWSTTQAHNAFLNILVSSGIIGFILFIICIFLASKKMRPVLKHPYTKILLVALMTYGIDFFMEMYQLPHLFFLILLLGYHIEDVIRCMPMHKGKTLRIRLASRYINL